jgi:hypothetical protein
MATEKQLAANLQNAQTSTGPITPEGKFISSHNAVKTGLTGQTVLLKTDDATAYKTHLQRFNEKFTPATDDERALLQDLADTEWRLLRILPLESSILAVGRRALAHMFEDETDPVTRESLIEGAVAITYRKDLSNLALQSTRLGRHLEKVTSKLDALQTARKAKSAEQTALAAEAFLRSQTDNWPCFHYRDFGFEFSLDQMFTGVANLRILELNLAFPDVARPYLTKEARKNYQAQIDKQNREGGAVNCHMCTKVAKAAKAA